jgi:ssDNA-binding Zn-finger/Zn-ribbon topoisomerase 1
MFIPWPTYPYWYPAPCQCNRCPTCGQYRWQQPQNTWCNYGIAQTNQGMAAQQQQGIAQNQQQAYGQQFCQQSVAGQGNK